MNKKRVSLLASIFLVVLVAVSSAMFLTNSGVAPFAKTSIIAFAAGTPDALGNRISSVYFNQNSTGSWSQVAILTYTSYVLNYNLTIPANQHTLVKCDVILNGSLAATAPTAMANTRVYLTISGVVTSASMIAQGCSYASSQWTVTFIWPQNSLTPTVTWVPATDTTYTITFQYQAYY